MLPKELQNKCATAKTALGGAKNDLARHILDKVKGFAKAGREWDIIEEFDDDTPLVGIDFRIVKLGELGSGTGRQFTPDRSEDTQIVGVSVSGDDIFLIQQPDDDLTDMGGDLLPDVSLFSADLTLDDMIEVAKIIDSWERGEVEVNS